MNLKEIEITISRMASIINADKKLLPTYGYSEDFARPHLEIDKNGMHYVIVERGKEQRRWTTDKIDQFLFWIFNDITATMSYKYELNNRDETKDFRRIAFKKQEELMGMLKLEWQKKVKKTHKNVLLKAPFDDNASPRAIYMGELRAKGLLEKEIERLAFEKFPKK